MPLTLAWLNKQVLYERNLPVEILMGDQAYKEFLRASSIQDNSKVSQLKYASVPVYRSNSCVFDEIKLISKKFTVPE